MADLNDKKVQAFSDIMTGVQQWADHEITLQALQDGIWQVLQFLESEARYEERVHGDMD